MKSNGNLELNSSPYLWFTRLLFAIYTKQQANACSSIRVPTQYNDIHRLDDTIELKFTNQDKLWILNKLLIVLQTAPLSLNQLIILNSHWKMFTNKSLLNSLLYSKLLYVNFVIPLYVNQYNWIQYLLYIILHIR